jgi:hypothetical protein
MHVRNMHRCTSRRYSNSHSQQLQPKMSGLGQPGDVVPLEFSAPPTHEIGDSAHDLLYSNTVLRALVRNTKHKISAHHNFPCFCFLRCLVFAAGDGLLLGLRGQVSWLLRSHVQSTLILTMRPTNTVESLIVDTTLHTLHLCVHSLCFAACERCFGKSWYVCLQLSTIPMFVIIGGQPRLSRTD